MRFLVALVLLSAGCSWVTPPLSSEEVLRQDPAFADLLTQRTAVSAEIQQLEQTLRGEQAAVLREIQSRRAALRAAERATHDQVQALEERLDPARQLLQAKLRDTEEKINAYLPVLDEMEGTGLVTLEKVKVLSYGPNKKGR